MAGVVKEVSVISSRGIKKQLLEDIRSELSGQCRRLVIWYFEGFDDFKGFLNGISVLKSCIWLLNYSKMTKKRS